MNIATNGGAANLDPLVEEAQRRGYLTVKDDRITYHCRRERQYAFTDSEEQVRAVT